MPNAAEKNQFRRLIGDYGKGAVSDAEIDSYLNDATYELTMDFVDSEFLSAPVSDFDTLVPQYRPEVVYYAAINYLWNRLAQLASKHSQSVGSVASNVGEEYERVAKLIETLQEHYSTIQTLGTDISIGNFSRFSKVTLTRLGGHREEELRDQ